MHQQLESPGCGLGGNLSPLVGFEELIDAFLELWEAIGTFPSIAQAILGFWQQKTQPQDCGLGRKPTLVPIVSAGGVGV